MDIQFILCFLQTTFFRRLRHTNIVTTFGVVPVDSEVGIVMELANTDLANLIKQKATRHNASTLKVCCLYINSLNCVSQIIAIELKVLEKLTPFLLDFKND